MTSEALVVERSAPITPEAGEVSAWLAEQHAFISSVIDGMGADRRAAAEAVEAAGANAVWFEQFGGRDDDAEAAYLGEVARSSIYIGLLGERYGRPFSSGYSATHSEYNEAERLGLRISMWVSGGDHDGRQNDFINEVAVFNTYGSYADPPALAAAVSRRLRALAAEGLSPWAKLGPVVFRTRRVRASAREIRIEAVTRDDDVYAALQRLADRRRSGDLHFTHDLSSLPVRVVDIATETTASRSRQLEIVLSAESISAGGGSFRDFSFEGRSPDDMTELALKVALLGAENPLGRMAFMASIDNPFDLLAGLGLSEDFVGPVIRVLLTEALLSTGRAERLTSFRLGPVHRGQRRVALWWLPRRRYVNEAPPAARHIEGIVRL